MVSCGKFQRCFTDSCAKDLALREQGGAADEAAHGARAGEAAFVVLSTLPHCPDPCVFAGDSVLEELQSSAPEAVILLGAAACV
jgi:hypothetical protein